MKCWRKSKRFLYDRGVKQNTMKKITELMEKMLDDRKMRGDDLVEDNTGGDIDNLD